MKIFECVPNVSEGRNLATLDAFAAAIEAAGVVLAHRTHDPVHHRAVFTFFGDAARVEAAALALAHATTARIDLRAHAGAHPRIGALDVLPIVPFGDATVDDARILAHAIAARLWSELRVPSRFYGAASANGDVLLADIRRGGFEGFRDSAAFDVGDVAHASAGAVAVGARAPLVAFNLVLRSGDLALVRAIARAIREKNGGLPGVRALGIALGENRVQVSCNITDPAATPLWRVTERVEGLAAEAGTTVERTELIGLVPRAVLEAVAAHALRVERLPHTSQ